MHSYDTRLAFIILLILSRILELTMVNSTVDFSGQKFGTLLVNFLKGKINLVL